MSWWNEEEGGEWMRSCDVGRECGKIAKNTGKIGIKMRLGWGGQAAGTLGNAAGGGGGIAR